MEDSHLLNSGKLSEEELRCCQRLLNSLKEQIRNIDKAELSNNEEEEEEVNRIREQLLDRITWIKSAMNGLLVAGDTKHYEQEAKKVCADLKVEGTAFPELERLLTQVLRRESLLPESKRKKWRCFVTFDRQDLETFVKRITEENLGIKLEEQDFDALVLKAADAVYKAMEKYRSACWKIAMDFLGATAAPEPSEKQTEATPKDILPDSNSEATASGNSGDDVGDEDVIFVCEKLSDQPAKRAPQSDSLNENRFTDDNPEIIFSGYGGGMSAEKKPKISVAVETESGNNFSTVDNKAFFIDDVIVLD
ncbi:unnamed protein product [Caenorhabditis auriculariae]|uniref:Uncharacterized protein n=1 Tax=Caenorhabditis auriculariae TaxID=2777116 RepID=A0A8S1GNW9_9PELO|nr:unnamed protein product [Caenorhabditis auriculariae]